MNGGMNVEQLILNDLAQTGAAERLADPVTEIVREHSRMVFKIAYAVLRNHADAEDATQEVFMRVVRHIGKVGQLRDAKAWTARIAWNVSQERAKDRMKSERRSAYVDDIQLAIEQLRSSDGGLEEIAISREQTSLLQSLIVGLPDDLREPLILSTVEEMTSTDIAKAMKIPEGSVRTRLMRARQLLRLKLASVLEGSRR